MVKKDYYNKNLLLVDLFTEMLISEKGYTHNTVTAYRTDLMLMGNYLAKKLISLGEKEIKRYLYSLNIKNLSIMRKISTFKTFYSFLLKEQLIKNSPMDKIDLPKKNLNIPKVLTSEQIDKIIIISKKQNIQLYLMIELIYSTGLRISEATQLKVSSIQTDFLFIKGKGNKERKLPIYSRLKKELNKYIKNRKLQYSDYLFGKTPDRPYSRQMLYNFLRKIAKKAGIYDNVSPHQLRHSFASHMLNNGANLRYIQQLLGHSSISTTQIYTHIPTDKIKKELQTYHPLANDLK